MLWFVIQEQGNGHFMFPDFYFTRRNENYARLFLYNNKN